MKSFSPFWRAGNVDMRVTRVPNAASRTRPQPAPPPTTGEHQAMSRFTLSRSEIRAEVERRKEGVASAHAAPPMPAAAATPRKRWSAKVFVVSDAVAAALARFASRAIHGVIDEPHVGERHSMRRHRGVYIWRPALDQRPDAAGEADLIVDMQNVSAAETEIRRPRQKPH